MFSSIALLIYLSLDGNSTEYIRFHVREIVVQSFDFLICYNVSNASNHLNVINRLIDSFQVYSISLKSEPAPLLCDGLNLRMLPKVFTLDKFKPSKSSPLLVK